MEEAEYDIVQLAMEYEDTTALHESGHAFMTWYLGFTVKGVLLNRDPDRLRETKTLGVVSSDADDWDLPELIRQLLPAFGVRYWIWQVKMKGLAAFAGPFVEGYLDCNYCFHDWKNYREAVEAIKFSVAPIDRTLSPFEQSYEFSTRHLGADGDVQYLNNVIAAFNGHRMAARLWDYWGREAWSIFQNPRARNAVHRITEELLENGFLEGSRVHRICRYSYGGKENRPYLWMVPEAARTFKKEAQQ